MLKNPIVCFLFFYQNITKDNKTQGIMEKSQWDLKHIRFRSSRLTRLDDFVVQYQQTHTALLREDETPKEFFQERFANSIYRIIDDVILMLSQLHII